MRETLDSLPLKDGFRQRGREMTRIETFTDAAFAFALTLLVMAGSAPTTLHGLLDILRDIPTFLFGAANLMVFWQGHNEWSRRYGLDDFRTMILSVALVACILIYVYPLRFVGNLFVNFVGARLLHLPVGHPPEGEFVAQDVNTAFIIYACGFVASGLVIVLLNLHAWNLRDELELNAMERHKTRAEIGAWVMLCSVGVVSALVGLVFRNIIGGPGIAYMLLPILMPLYGKAMDRGARQVEVA